MSLHLRFVLYTLDITLVLIALQSLLQQYKQINREYAQIPLLLLPHIDFDVIFELMNPNKVYTPLPKYPATTRDFSFVCDESLEVGTIFDEIKKTGGKLVEDIALFDIYRGVQIGEGKKSVSIRVTFRATDRTLTVEETEKVSAKVLKALENQLGISLRA